MEVQDGFIVGIFNYCDRWCERCAFTSHCRLFADGAEASARTDANFKPIVDAPPLPAEAAPPPQWVREMIAEWNAASTEPPPAEELEPMEPGIAPEHLPIRDRGYAYAARAHRWLRVQNRGRSDTDDACDVIDWFAIFIAAKISRSLQTWPGYDFSSVRDGDSAGSAKIALIAIERSHAAWLTLVEREFVTASEADSFIADLVWLGDALERARPHARAFVRPGLDEPAAAARLRAGGYD